MLKLVLLLFVMFYTCEADVYGQVNFLDMPKPYYKPFAYRRSDMEKSNLYNYPDQDTDRENI